MLFLGKINCQLTESKVINMLVWGLRAIRAPTGRWRWWFTTSTPQGRKKRGIGAADFSLPFAGDTNCICRFYGIVVDTEMFRFLCLQDEHAGHYSHASFANTITSFTTSTEH